MSTQPTGGDDTAPDHHQVDGSGYRRLFHQIADPILVADAGGRYIDANPAATALLGYARDELLALRAPDVVAAGPAWDDAEFARLLREHAWRGELELRCAEHPHPAADRARTRDWHAYHRPRAACRAAHRG